MTGRDAYSIAASKNVNFVYTEETISTNMPRSVLELSDLPRDDVAAHLDGTYENEENKRLEASATSLTNHLPATDSGASSS